MAKSLATVLQEMSLASTKTMEHLYHRALAGKVSHMRNGYIGRHGIWDSTVFDQVRQEAGLETLRFVVIGCQDKNSPNQTVLDVLRAHFACPVITSLYHPAIATFLTSSHPYDLQFFGERVWGANVHVGPGVTNIESKLKLVGEENLADPGQYRGVVSAPVSSCLEPFSVVSAASRPGTRSLSRVARPFIGGLARCEKAQDGEETLPWFVTNLEAKLLRTGLFGW